MRRRDEPKLDDLKKLLRRLENIEVDTGLGRGQHAARDAAPEPSGYVGALRGAPVAIVDGEKDEGRYRGEDYGYGSATEPSAEKSRSFGMASIVIGAATAAIVSSLAAVALLLWTDGQSAKTGPDMRFPASIPKQPTLGAPSQAGPASIYTSPSSSELPVRAEDGGPGVPAPAIAPESPSTSVAAAIEADTLLHRAQVLLRSGSLAEARQLLQRAASLGSGAAALTLGATYDPARMAEFGRLGAQADPAIARAWYERARALGANEATARLTELAKR